MCLNHGDKEAAMLWCAWTLGATKTLDAKKLQMIPSATTEISALSTRALTQAACFHLFCALMMGLPAVAKSATSPLVAARVFPTTPSATTVTHAPWMRTLWKVVF